MVKIILVSTFRHLFLGLGLALENDNDQWHILFIDQRQNENENEIFKAAKSVGLPFSTIEMIPSKLNGQSKAKYRQFAFSWIQRYLEKLRPDEILTGNDRRLEFQYAMFFTRCNINKCVEGSYLDDGTGSYRNMYDFNFRKQFSDKYIDTPVKKIIYGSWYDRPVTLGASKWISKSYLTFPSLAMGEIRRPLVQVPAKIYFSSEMYFILKRYFDYFDVGDFKASDSIVLFVLPHSSIIDELYGDLHSLKLMVNEIVNRYDEVYVKYHPRELGDPLGIKSTVKLVPSNIPVEFLLAFFRFEMIIGDVSTALMSARWLQPNCDVRYIDTNTKHSEVLLGIFKRIGVNVFN